MVSFRNKQNVVDHVLDAGRETQNLIITQIMKDLGYPLEVAFQYKRKVWKKHSEVRFAFIRELEDDEFDQVKQLTEVLETIDGKLNSLRMAVVRVLNKADKNVDYQLIVDGVYGEELDDARRNEYLELSEVDWGSVKEDRNKIVTLSNELNALYFLHGGRR